MSLPSNIRDREYDKFTLDSNGNTAVRVTMASPVTLNFNINPRGEYNNATTYHLGDIVTFNGVSYIATTTITGINPPAPQWQTIYDPELAVGSNILLLEAGENISAMKLVYINNLGKAMIAKNNGTYEQSRCVGISRNAVMTGNVGAFVAFGEVTDSMFTFASGNDLFLGVNGFVTDVAPTSGYLTKVGNSLWANKVLINITDTIVL